MAVVIKDFFNHVEEFMHYRKIVYEASSQTVKSNLIDINLFQKFIDKKRYKVINGQSVMAFQKYLKIDRANCGLSINRKIFTLRSYSHFLKLQDVADSETLPFYDVLKIRQGYRNRPNALIKSRIKKMFGFIDRSTCLGIRDYAVFSLMYLCGLRVGEVFGLNIYDLDFKKKVIHVLGKGRKSRTLHLTTELCQVISEHIAIRKYFLNSDKSEALFISKKGNRLAIRTMEDNFKKLVNKSNLNTRFRVTCHTLRHSFASHLNDKEVDMLVIQSLMGHTSSRSTEPYIHPSSIKVKEALEKLPGVVFMNKLINERGFNIKFQNSGVKL